MAGLQSCLPSLLQSILPSLSGGPQGCLQHNLQTCKRATLYLTRVVLHIKTRLLRWEINLDYPGEPDVITRVLKNGKRHRTGERRLQRVVRKMQRHSFQDERRGHSPKRGGRPPKLEKERQWFAPRAFQKEHSPTGALNLAQRDPC